MKVICHIGHPKTASTFLQNTCAQNAGWLRGHGILYPDMLVPDVNHISLLYACANYISVFARDYGIESLEEAREFGTRLSAHLRRQIDEANGEIHTVLLSSENLTANISGPQGVQNLADFLSEIFDEVRILVYLRRQDDALLSMYGEYMRRGFGGMTFDSFVDEALGNTVMVPYIFHRRILEFWNESFGRDRVTVRIFDRDELVGQDILTDFFDVVFSGNPPDMSQLRRSANDNTGLSAPALEFLRQMHPFISYHWNGKPNPLRQRLQGRIETLPVEPRARLSREQSERIMARFSSANEWVRTTYFPDKPAPLFPPRRREDPTSNLGQITISEFAQFTGHLLL